MTSPDLRSKIGYHTTQARRALQYLSSDQRDRLPSDPMADIGGRDPQVTQIVWSLEGRVKESFPINGVPANLAGQLADLHDLAARFEIAYLQAIEQFADGLKAPK